MFAVLKRSPLCSTYFSSPEASAHSCSQFSTPSPAKGCEAMLFDYLLGGIVTAIIMVYLVYALIRPERF